MIDKVTWHGHAKGLSYIQYAYRNTSLENELLSLRTTTKEKRDPEKKVRNIFASREANFASATNAPWGRKRGSICFRNNSSSSLNIGSLSTRVSETRTATGRGHFSCQDSCVSQIFTLIISNGKKILRNPNVVV